MIQLNNPGNIRPGNNFQGEVGEVNNFSQFDTMQNGCRAYFKNLHAAIFKHGRKTLRAYITAYAPPSENDTPGYILQMSEYTGIKPDAEIPLNSDFLVKFAQVQFIIENGQIANIIPVDIIEAALMEVPFTI